MKSVIESLGTGGREEILQSLAAGYSPAKRRLEIASMVVFVGLQVVLLQRIYQHVDRHNAWIVAAFFFASIVAADFVSGLVHWFADTWGNTSWPLVGQSLIRSFREHHVDQTAIARHDFIETNGDNCFVALPLLFTMLFVPIAHEVGFIVVTAVTLLCLTVSTTSQIHKWAHQSPADVPSAVRVLQRMGLIISPGRHAGHHRFPHMGGYCITTGWCNPLLDRLGFFRILERAIAALTGAIPRQDDFQIARRAATPLDEISAQKSESPNQSPAWFGNS